MSEHIAIPVEMVRAILSAADAILHVALESNQILHLWEDEISDLETAAKAIEQEMKRRHVPRYGP
jgi:hypothetical protein